MCSGQNLFNNCVPQPGTATLLETLTNWPMQPLQYRNFGSRDTLVFTHSVDENGSDHAGVRWYELRRATPGIGAWTMFQGATHAPDARHRWMGSAALNGAGDMAVGYSVSDGASVFPGIRYAGRLVDRPAKHAPQGEFTLVNGATFLRSDPLGRLLRDGRRPGRRLHVLVHGGVHGHRRSENSDRRLQVPVLRTDDLDQRRLAGRGERRARPCSRSRSPCPHRPAW